MINRRVHATYVSQTLLKEFGVKKLIHLIMFFMVEPFIIFLLATGVEGMVLLLLSEASTSTCVVVGWRWS